MESVDTEEDKRLEKLELLCKFNEGRTEILTKATNTLLLGNSGAIAFCATILNQFHELNKRLVAIAVISFCVGLIVAGIQYLLVISSFDGSADEIRRRIIQPGPLAPLHRDAHQLRWTALFTSAISALGFLIGMFVIVWTLLEWTSK